MVSHEVAAGRRGRSLFPALSSGLIFVFIAICASAAHSQANTKNAAAERGRKQFAQSCGFCHGVDATGGRGPDLVRSPLVAHDQNGDLIGDVIRTGRPDKGMPALPLSPEQISDITDFLHDRALEALHSSGVPSDYPAEKLLTGNPEAGKAFFEGVGGCKNCHRSAADLAAGARKYSSIEFESRMLYPGSQPLTAVVTLPSGEQIRGKVIHEDDFMIGVQGESGWYKSFARDKVKAEIHDPMEAHRKLLDKFTQSDMHNLFTYLYGLK